MHVPDGFLDAPTSVATGAVAAAGIAVALRKSRNELDDRTAPMAGLVAAFVFAGQMINFPVGAGTSGHLMGGALAAVLVGPWTGVLSVSVVLMVQALFMADGGITALGSNVVLLALVACFVGYVGFRAAMVVLPKKLPSVPIAAGFGAFASVPVAAAVFTGLFAIGGQTDVDLGTVLTAMLGWHTVIGIGEALVTALVVSAVVGSRPDLVHGARRLERSPLDRLRTQRQARPTAGRGTTVDGEVRA